MDLFVLIRFYILLLLCKILLVRATRIEPGASILQAKCVAHSPACPYTCFQILCVHIQTLMVNHHTKYRCDAPTCVATDFFINADCRCICNRISFGFNAHSSLDTMSLPSQLEALRVGKEHKNFSDLQFGDYVIQKFSLINTIHGTRIRIEIDDWFMILPGSYPGLMEEDLTELNKFSIVMTYSGKDVNNRIHLQFSLLVDEAATKVTRYTGEDDY